MTTVVVTTDNYWIGKNESGNISTNLVRQSADSEPFEPPRPDA